MSEARYFEDYPPGAVFEGGPIAVSEADILGFARSFDPQDMHLDPAVANAGPFGGVIASGWHTGALMMRLFADHFLSSASSLPSPGVDELRWARPVRPGDVLRLRATVLEAKPSRSKPDRGMIRSLVELRNQRDEVVMTLKPMSIVRRRSI